MAKKDGKGSGFLIEGKKAVDQVQVPVYAVGHDDGMKAHVVGTYPMDADVQYVYQSRAGGFVPPSIGGDTCFSQLHYGQGAFEGMRFYYSKNGVVLPRPWANYARLLHSGTTFQPLLARIAVEELMGDGGAVSMKLGIPLTPASFYDLAEGHFRKGEEMSYPLVIEYADGRTEMRQVEMALQITGHDGAVTPLTMRKIDTTIKALAYTGGLVSVDHYPQTAEMIASGYIRPWIWMSGEAGLKLPTVVKSGDSVGTKPMYFACATLPWGLYLTEELYAAGLDTVVSPYQRIDGTVMPSTAKAAGTYLNQLGMINMSHLMGFGEIITLSRDGKFVEGSVENAFVIMIENGRFVAYTPPVSDGCLPGTTRDAVIRTLEKMDIEVRYQSVELRNLYGAKAIVLTGTGAQMIHVRSITEMEAPGKLAELTGLRSEELVPVPTELTREDFVGRKRLINGGERHPIVPRIQKEYKRMLNAGKRLEPVHNIDFMVLAELAGVDVCDFMSRRDKQAERAGYFRERVNGLKQPDELAKKNRRVARLIKRAMDKRSNKGLKLSALDRRIKRKPSINAIVRRHMPKR